MSASFLVDDETDANLGALMAHYGLASKSAALDKAVRLLKVISQNESPDHSFLLQREDQSLLCVRIRPVAPCPPSHVSAPTSPNPLEEESA